MPKRPCARPGCSNLVAKGYCDRCKPRSTTSLTEQRRGSAHARGYTQKWSAAAAAFLREHPFCGDIYKQHGERLVLATEVDHVIPHRGDPKLFWSRRNWQPLCRECHSAKTAREDGGFGRRN